MRAGFNAKNFFNLCTVSRCDGMRGSTYPTSTAGAGERVLGLNMSVTSSDCGIMRSCPSVPIDMTILISNGLKKVNCNSRSLLVELTIPSVRFRVSKGSMVMCWGAG